jgi:TRAP-type mannitol/chloroaromatic compound transport system permease small subunit
MQFLINYFLMGFLLFGIIDLFKRYSSGNKDSCSFLESLFYVFIWPIMLLIIIRYTFHEDEEEEEIE